jgi:hypothetical protein
MKARHLCASKFHLRAAVINFDQGVLDMSDEKNSGRQSEQRENPSAKKQNNPFSEQEKHGDEAQRRAPGSEREYQGDPSVQRRDPGDEENVDEDDDSEDQERRIA